MKFKASPNSHKYRITRAALAAALGTSTKMITQKYEHAKVIEADEEGLFGIGAIMQILQHEADLLGDGGNPKQDSDIAKNKAQTEKATNDAELARIKIQVMRGALLPTVLVERFMGEAMVTLRARLLAMPGQVVKRLAMPPKKRKELQVEIGEEINTELTRTAEELDKVVEAVIKESAEEELHRKK